MAARRQRRQQEAKRKGQEEAAQKILEEQSHLAINSKPTTAEHIVIPNVVAGQSPEEQVGYGRFISYLFISCTANKTPIWTIFMDLRTSYSSRKSLFTKSSSFLFFLVFLTIHAISEWYEKKVSKNGHSKAFLYLNILSLQALKREQERSLEELQERQQEEMERLEDKLAREAKDSEHKEMQDFEAYRERTLREAKNRQAAELSARSDLSAAETQQVTLIFPVFCVVNVFKFRIK